MRRTLSVRTMFACCLAALCMFPVAPRAAAQNLEERRVLSQEIGVNQGRGNLLGIQPFMTARDYRSRATFAACLEKYLAFAKQRRWITPRTVVVFPETIGFYLVASEEQDAVYNARSLRDATSIMLTRYHIEPPNDTTGLLQQEIELGLRRKLLDRKAPRMAAIYQDTFSDLARRYHVTIVAGSLFLPGPHVRHGKLLSDLSHPIYNVSGVFRPDGSLSPDLVRKSFPTREESEEMDVTPGPVAALPVFVTPIGTVGVAICADTWYPETYRVLQKKGARLIVSPAYGFQSRSALWAGYSLGKGVQPAADVAPTDIGALTEEAAWRKYAMPGRLGNTPQNASDIPYGMTVFLQGHLWEQSADPVSPYIMDRGKLRSGGTKANAPAVISFWMPTSSPPH